PFQLEPALACLAGARRVVIADAVGLGKTIQAGLVIAEMQRRKPDVRVLVPSSLRAQWHEELRTHFDIDALQADARAMADAAQLELKTDRPWRRAGIWLASIDYVKQPHVFDAVA